MASLKFLIQSKSTSAPIYARLSISRKQIYKRKTGLFIAPSQWSKATGFPKGKDDEGKKLRNKLKALEADILSQINNESSEGREIDGEWLLHKIDLHFNRVTENVEQSELLIDAVQDFINNADLRKNSKGGTGLSKSRVQGIKRLKSLLTEFLKRKKARVSDVDLKFSRKFSTWLHKDQNYSRSYTLKMIDNLKTICRDAEVNGVPVSPHLKNVKGGKVKNETVLYLSPQEQNKIKNKELKSKALINARKWLILGCNIGQRGGDLLKLTKANLMTQDGRMIIELTQKKTGKHIYIPLNSEAREAIEDGFPRPISMQKFNEYIKLLCKEAEINKTVTAGKVSMVPSKKDPEKKVKRKIVKEYKKWEVVTSHICRRSFASNLHGKLAAPFIMNITGHSSEKEFLNYIGKTSADYVSPILDFFDKQEAEKTQQEEENTKETNLEVVRDKAVNQ